MPPPAEEKEAAWTSLVARSKAAWNPLDPDLLPVAHHFLSACPNLSSFLSRPPSEPMFWFFQLRSSFLAQTTMSKWSPQNLHSYILLPALPGFVTRSECFFVSHFWHSPDDPDPGGKYLRLLQGDLARQEWGYIWVDWTCAPQAPRRTGGEEQYFLRTLQSMSGIIRNAGFAWWYPPFEPRLWVLYEVAEYMLTCEEGVAATEDMRVFAGHVMEMIEGGDGDGDGVRGVLERYGYRCSYERDREFLTSWLEVLVILRRLPVDIGYVRRLQDNLTWLPGTPDILAGTDGGLVRILRYEGRLEFNGECHRFTPFPDWRDGKFSTGMEVMEATTRPVTESG